MSAVVELQGTQVCSSFSPKVREKFPRIQSWASPVGQGSLCSGSLGDCVPQASAPPCTASVSSLHIGCFSGDSYRCSLAVSSLHGALGYHGDDLVLTPHLLQHLCLLTEMLETKTPVGSVLVSPLVQSAVTRNTESRDRQGGSYTRNASEGREHEPSSLSPSSLGIRPASSHLSTVI